MSDALEIYANMNKNQNLAFAICEFLSTSIEKGIIQNENVEGIEGDYHLSHSSRSRHPVYW